MEWWLWFITWFSTQIFQVWEGVHKIRKKFIILTILESLKRIGTGNIVLTELNDKVTEQI